VSVNILTTLYLKEREQKNISDRRTKHTKPISRQFKCSKSARIVHLHMPYQLCVYAPLLQNKYLIDKHAYICWTCHGLCNCNMADADAWRKLRNQLINFCVYYKLMIRKQSMLSLRAKITRKAQGMLLTSIGFYLRRWKSELRNWARWTNLLRSWLNRSHEMTSVVRGV
jgi:hypothetical protein